MMNSPAMNRNPYLVDDQPPALRGSVFAFIDILGYRELIQASQATGTQQETLRKLHAALLAGRQWLQDDDDVTPQLRDLFTKDRYALKAFTDNIVIGWPVRDDAESEFGDAFFRLGAFQLQLVLEGFFLRGAISVDYAYIDEIAVFGEALTEAYVGESTLSRDPRIILTASGVRAARGHLTYYSDPSRAPHVRDLLRDADGQWFLNYLQTILMAEEEQGPFYEEFHRHKIAVEDKLREYKRNPPIWSKYAWVAGYHNYFCDLHSQHFGEEHRIDVGLFKIGPALIVDDEMNP